ncbi:MarR family winged helix-turn-helix transcriptional regulator [Leptospira sp. GIMC2001]|uniref:MarR family winged helix-turn-helix transcriptional regulator n=1 Tax=Leptospira sp. GIMC2001 TaxID=1513297 RepID=UPI0023496289|nr:MarR family transcriptional regulator [Leptospira sp. GIMC2001]WCL51409.1 MarR family transcriptional regulator [Leptospira sp. GIMC2001]
MGTKFKGTKREIQSLNAFIKLKRASESLSAKLNHSMQEFNLTESQFGIMEALYHLGPLCQKELGMKILKSTGNITLVIDNLEKRKLVLRNRTFEDRRYISITLTEEGHELISRFLPHHVTAITSEFSVLSVQEMDTLGKICKKLGLSITNSPECIKAHE